MSRRVEYALLILVLLIALAVRFYGLGFDLPFTSNPDEPNIVDHAVATLKTGNWNPGWFIYPSGYHYLQVGVQGLQLLWGMARGTYSSVADLPDSSATITTAPDTYLWARGTTVLFGVLAVLLVYRLGKRLFGPTAGLAGALLLALSPLHIEHSQFVTTDVPTAFLCLLAVSLALEVLEYGGVGRALLAGLVVGAAGAFKYNAVVALLPLLLALVMRAVCSGEPQEGFVLPLRRFFNRELGLALLGVAIGYAVLCPFTFGSLPTFLDDLGYETHVYRFGGEQGVVRLYETDSGLTLPPWLAYSHYLLSRYENPLAGLTYLGGIVLALARRRKQEVLLLVFALGYYLFLSSYNSIFVRNILPALPALAVLGGGFLSDALSWLLGRFASSQPLARFQPAALGLVLIALLARPTAGILGAGRYRATPKSEVQVRRWLDEHVQPGERVAVEIHPLLFAHSPYHVTSIDYLSNYPLDAFVNLGGHTQNLPGPRLTIFRVPDLPLHPQQRLETVAGPGVRLLGFDAGKRREEGDLAYVTAEPNLRAGQVLGLTLYLQADKSLPEDYLVRVRLIDAAGKVVASQEQAPCAGACPASQWIPGQVVVDREDMPLPPALPAGTYQLELQVLRPENKEPLPFTPVGSETTELLLRPIPLLERAP